jgi:hypothetical protein
MINTGTSATFSRGPRRRAAAGVLLQAPDVVVDGAALHGLPDKVTVVKNSPKILHPSFQLNVEHAHLRGPSSLVPYAKSHAFSQGRREPLGVEGHAALEVPISRIAQCLEQYVPLGIVEWQEIQLRGSAVQDELVVVHLKHDDGTLESGHRLRHALLLEVQMVHVGIVDDAPQCDRPDVDVAQEADVRDQGVQERRLRSPASLLVHGVSHAEKHLRE